MDREKLRAYVRREFLFDRSAQLDDDQVLFPDVVDSLGLMDVVTFIEESYGVEINEDELIVDNFRTISDIARLVESKEG